MNEKNLRVAIKIYVVIAMTTVLLMSIFKMINFEAVGLGFFLLGTSGLGFNYLNPTNFKAGKISLLVFSYFAILISLVFLALRIFTGKD